VKKNITYILLAVFALFLAQNAAHGINGQPLASQDAVESEVPCPGEDFSVFLAKFADDETVQRAFIIYPLTKLELDYDAEPGPEPFIRSLDRDQVQFPVFPSRQNRADWSLEIRIESVSENNAEAILFLPDTGYMITYLFRKNGCWRLERIEDWSM
jgi:hypothetical protein